jgi:hypothetical protein
LPEGSKAMEGFLKNVDWAFDIADAMKLLSENKYSLHILDADIPRVMPEERKEIFRKAIINGDYPSSDYQFLKDPRSKQIGDGYVLVYDKARENTVVLSSSQVAPITAFALKIPFYSKAAGPINNLETFLNKRAFPTGTFNPVDVEQTVMKIRKERYGNDYLMQSFSNEEFSQMDKWERGGLDDFVNKYILKK